MIKEFQIRVLPVVASNEENIRRYMADEEGIDIRTINAVRVLKRSIDARQRTVFVNLKVRLYINEFPQAEEYVRTDYGDVNGKPAVIVVGEGPGGLFASLRLIELGLRPIVLERGKDVRERKKDLANITKTQTVEAESNYCFGEGGAGAYSDGKLYTRSKKRGSIEKILNVFCQHGASTAILADAHPHIGTDKLPKVIENMRNTIIKCGGEVHFQTKMTRLLISSGTVVGVEAVGVASGAEMTFRGPVILATGHSARDVYRYLAEAKIEIEAKGIAVGVRLEHPSQLIDQIQYHNRDGRGKYLPAAEYSFVTQVDGRGVYSFCMCPGGYVVNASSEEGRTCVNGMSYSGRSGKNANSAIIVSVTPQDFGADDPLAGMRFQRHLEEENYKLGGGRIPQQLFGDYVQNVKSSDYGAFASQTKGQTVLTNLRGLMSEDMERSFIDGMTHFSTKIKNFDRADAILSGMETRTSSPVRILRNENCESALPGLYPCGEGAGYAGGIMSAAIDGLKVASAIMERFCPAEA